MQARISCILCAKHFVAPALSEGPGITLGRAGPLSPEARSPMAVLSSVEALGG